MGVDTFILSNDVEAYLRNCKIIEGGKDTKKSLDSANKIDTKLHYHFPRVTLNAHQIHAS